MGHIVTHDTITCPNCGHEGKYCYSFDHNHNTNEYDFSDTAIYCDKCGETLYSWQELKYGNPGHAKVDTRKDYEPHKSGYDKMKVFAIYDCDEWHSRASYRLICISDAAHINEILHRVLSEREYTDEDMERYIAIEERILNDF